MVVGCSAGELTHQDGRPVRATRPVSKRRRWRRKL